ncbi:oxidoreductase [Xylanimonas oleitrophica]|uniref:Oxidoreductase n=1 Tax=Xylanimonas oleitrophica TaxID=2607479 RepID=A0A2W5Y9W3_9MICO|nr:oxidoreductase [Xylanimonas oleitrophica]
MHHQASARPLAVVTGASSGIGLELARELVARGFDVVATAEDDVAAATRDLAPPRDLARPRDLAEAGAWVQPVQADLRTTAGLRALEEAVLAVGRPVEVLALNAGVGNSGAFVDTPLEKDLDVVAVNVTALVHLAKRLVPPMAERGRGRVLVTSSVAALMPGPYYATYAASKAFALSFAEALRHELRRTGVTVTALLPGPTATDYFAGGPQTTTPMGRGPKDSPAKVARDACDALFAGKDKVVVRSVKARTMALLGSVLPLRARTAVHALAARPSRAGREASRRHDR